MKFLKFGKISVACATLGASLLGVSCSSKQDTLSGIPNNIALKNGITPDRLAGIAAAALIDGSSVPPTAANGLKADYFKGTNLELNADSSQPASSLLLESRQDGNINFKWGSGSFDSTKFPAKTNQYSVRWTGSIQLPSNPAGDQLQDYAFISAAADGVRVYIDDMNTPVISNWKNHVSASVGVASKQLMSGQKYSIKVEYYDALDASVAQLYWALPDQDIAIVPSSALFAPVVTPPVVTPPVVTPPVVITPPATSCDQLQVPAGMVQILAVKGTFGQSNVFDFSGQPALMSYGAGESFALLASLQLSGAASASNGVIFSQSGSSGGNINLAVVGGKLVATIGQDGTASTGGIQLNGGTVNDGNWHTYGLVRSGSPAGQIALYLDGVLQASSSGAVAMGAISPNASFLGIDKRQTANPNFIVTLNHVSVMRGQQSVSGLNMAKFTCVPGSSGVTPPIVTPPVVTPPVVTPPVVTPPVVTPPVVTPPVVTPPVVTPPVVTPPVVTPPVVTPPASGTMLNQATARDFGVVGVGAQYAIPCEADPTKTCKMNKWPAFNDFGMIMYSSDVWTDQTFFPYKTFADFQFESMMFDYSIREYADINGNIYKIKIQVIPVAYDSDEEGPLTLSVDGQLHTMPLSPKVLPWGHVPNAQYVTKKAVNGAASIQVKHFNAAGNATGQDGYAQSDMIPVFKHAALMYDYGIQHCVPENYWCFYYVNVGQTPTSVDHKGNSVAPAEKSEVVIMVNDPTQNPMKGPIDLGKYRLTVQRGWRDPSNPGTFTQIQAEDLQEVLSSMDGANPKFELPQSQYGFIAGSAPGAGRDPSTYYRWLNADEAYGWTQNPASRPPGIYFNSESDPAFIAYKQSGHYADPGLCEAPGNRCDFFVNNPKAITYRDWIWSGGLDRLRSGQDAAPPVQALWWDAPVLTSHLVTFDQDKFYPHFDGHTGP